MSFRVLFIIASAVFYYRVGHEEYGRGFMWASISILMSIVTTSLVPLGTTGFLIGQGLIFGGMTFYNMRREAEKRAGSE